MTLFSNDTGQDISKDGLEAVRESEAGKGQDTLSSGMVRSSVVSCEWSSSAGNMVGMGGVESTEAILAPDYPVLEHNRQLFDEKRPPNFKERPFQHLIGDLIPITCPEMTLFSNDTWRDLFPDRLEAVWEREAGKGQDTYFPGMVRSSVVICECSSRAGNMVGLGGVESTEAVLASDYLVFRTK